MYVQDPLGLSADGDVDKFNRYRAIEIKHGRGKQPTTFGRPYMVGRDSEGFALW